MVFPEWGWRVVRLCQSRAGYLGKHVYTHVRRCVNRCEPVSRGDVKMWKVRIQNGMRGQKSGPCRVTGAQSHQEAPQADRRVS